MLGIILVIILVLNIFLWLIVYGSNKNKTNDEIFNEEMRFCKKDNLERKQRNEKK